MHTCFSRPRCTHITFMLQYHLFLAQSLSISQLQIVAVIIIFTDTDAQNLGRKRVFVHMQNLLPIKTTCMELTVPQLAKELSPKIHYNIHKSLTLVYILSQTKSIHHAQLSLKSTLMFSSCLHPGSLSFKFPHQNPVGILVLSHACYMPHPSHPP